MRERTTWSREEIAKRAAGRTADDPRAMNQDHFSQQPADDEYVTGGPSEFAEDVTPPNWKVEQSGGETKRNEIGMPDMLPDTFKTAGLDEETLTKKAEVCIRVARQMLAGAGESAIEDQAYALMHMPDVELIQTADRLAKGQVPPEFLEQQQKMKDKAKDKDESDDEGQGQQQKKQGQQQKQQGQQQDEDEEDDGQQKQAKKSQDEEEEEIDVEEVEQQKQAAYKVAAKAIQAGDVEGFQGAINDIVAHTLTLTAQQQKQQQQKQQQDQDKQSEEGDEGQDKQAGQGCMNAQQVEQMIQQAIDAKTMGQQLQQQLGQQLQQPQMQQQLSDDQLLDQMLQDQGEVQQMPQIDVQLEGAPMDIGETPLGPEDEILGQLFAANKEVQQATQAQALQDGLAAPAPMAPIKTASTRTVGTRPTGGVSQIGGSGSANVPGTGDVDKLSGLWRSAPDVSGVFNPEG